MNFTDVVKKRRSVRNYEEKKIVEKDKLNQILDSANLAPSAGDNQCFEIIVVEEQLLLNQLWENLTGQTFAHPAHLALIFCADEKRSAEIYGARGKELFCTQDATIAAAYAQLAATDLGLATVWAGSFNDAEVKKIIQAPAHLRPVVILPLGYAAEEPPRTVRRQLSDIVHVTIFKESFDRHRSENLLVGSQDCLTANGIGKRFIKIKGPRTQVGSNAIPTNPWN